MEPLNLKDVKPGENVNSQPQPLEPSNIRKVAGFFWEIFKVVVISLAIIVPVRMFVIQPFIVEGKSMYPSFDDGQYLVVDEISYRFSDLQRGDVVVFHPPSHPEVYYIKRVIALAGETVEFKDGSIYIYNQEHPDGIKLSELSYLPDSELPANQNQTFKLNDSQYFLLGDNRYNSYDSRGFGPVTKENIRGKVLLRAFPFDRFNFFQSPAYNF